MDRDVLSRVRTVVAPLGAFLRYGISSNAMKIRSCTIFVVMVLLAGVPAADAQELFGPVRYDVRERYGKDNLYQETFNAPERLSLIKIQNGTRPSERPDFIDLSLNGVKLLGNEPLGYPFIACFVSLGKKNTLELNLRDQKPSGMRRPLPAPKFILLSVMPAFSRFPEGIYGISTWNGLKDLVGGIQKIKSPASASLAVSAVDLQQDVSTRTEAMRKLSARKDPAAQDIILFLYGDAWAAPEVRAEAAAALGTLGDTRMIPLLMNGLLDPNEKIGAGAARALSLFKEEETRQQLSAMLERLDPIRKTAVIRAMSGAGWRPLGTMMDMAGSPDPYVANVAIEILGHMRNARVSDFLLTLLANPGARSTAVILTSLGESRDSRVVEHLLAIAKDPEKRKGMEASLGAALANLGDARAAEVIQEMAQKARTRSDHLALQEAYRRLTGKDPELPHP